ncbi:MAG TPA: bifunctional riboflavin kinase/FAD synthetase [Ktedonobacterales bacterium]|nr:bifunctional riboflavin kinase/FAD synthetase [Ktedonobacterales bacterium]
MQIVYDFGPATVPALGPAVLTIGFFDGVHLGHQRLIERAGVLAAERGVAAVAVTFWPHPSAILRPDAAPPLLTTLAEKLRLLGELGRLAATVVLPFDEALSRQSPEVFLDTIAAFCRPVALVEGPDFAMGHKRAGDLAFLRAAGERRGFAVETHEERVDGERVSSTRIRTLLRAGEAEAATRLLGRPYSLVGEVVEGDRRGRLLGFPTANLRLDARTLLPANGVYAVRVRLPGEARAAHPAVCNIGVRPTFGGEPRLIVEVHLLDAAMDLYGLTLAVEVVARLRDERRFAGVDELKAQIGADAERARALLAGAAAGRAARDLTPGAARHPLSPRERGTGGEVAPAEESSTWA